MQTANLQTMLRPLIPGYTVPPVTRTITLIVIHCTASRCTSNLTPETLELLHRQRGFNGCGYHYYIQKNGTIHPMRPLNLAGAHAYGHNAHSIGIAYEGGLLSDGTAADTRTPEQRSALRALLTAIHTVYPSALILGHRDLSPDLNHNGTIEPEEYIKQCPCFDAIPEYSDLLFRTGTLTKHFLTK